jgi:predicted metal-dependent enzyme (double-stranded beta helix superfamily)
MSTHWIRIQVLWLHEEWGREEMFYHRRRGKCKDWTDEEKKILSEQYLSLPAPQLMALFPDRTWKAIRSYGAQITKTLRSTVYRKEDIKPSQKHYSHSDLTFMREHKVDEGIPYTNWVTLSAPEHAL